MNDPDSFGLQGDKLAQSFADLRRDASGFASGFATDLTRATEAMRQGDREAKNLSRTLSSGLKSAFDKIVFGGGKASDVLKGLARDLAGATLNAALQPLQQAVGKGISGAVNSLVPNLFGGLGLFENGAAFSSGRVRAFAKGGVVSGPTTFPMRGGTGLMGEAGPEAIMPLSRGPDGKLGVASQGGGGVSVTVNIAASDVESFRRSQSQISATLARAVSRGQRNL